MDFNRLLRRVTLLAGILATFATSCAGGGIVAEQQTENANPNNADPAPVATGPTTRPQVTSQPSTSEASTSEAQLVRSPIVLGFAGDTSFTAGLSSQGPFDAILEMLQRPDLMVLNLETAVADPDVGRPPVQKRFLFRSPPESLDLLVEAGVDVVALANNHSLDYGADALKQTLAEIDARPLLRVGAGADQAAAYVPLIVKVGDWQVGIVSLSRVPCDWSASGENTRPEVAWACPAFEQLAESLVTTTVADTDFTVVMVHGGEEGVLCPSGFMTDLEQKWADLGVDLVVDGHPHVLQGITSLLSSSGSESMVIHSTGNFAFPSARGITANTAIFEVTVSDTEPWQDNGDNAPTLSVRLLPLRSGGGILVEPTNSERDAIISQVNGVSQGWLIDSAGHAYRDAGHTGSC